MKKKSLLQTALAVATLVVAGYGGMKAYDNSYGKNVNNDESMLMANVEALSDGEGGTPRAQCYTTGTGDYGFYYACSDSTTTEMMYPCPPEVSQIKPGVTDYCSK